MVRNEAVRLHRLHHACSVVVTIARIELSPSGMGHLDHGKLLSPMAEIVGEVPMVSRLEGYVVRWTDRLMYTSKLINSFNLPLAVVVAALLWRSLDWRVVGDAAIFHFIAVQMQMGAVPYRDIVDINMPLIYLIHAAIVTVGGVGDVVWRVFDLTAAVLMSGLILMLVWPAGRAAAIHAVLIVLVIHLLLGPYAAGQRDYLMSIPALGAALASAKSAEESRDRWLYLVLAGAFVASAAAIKPTGILLIGLPVAARGGLQWRDAAWSVVGAATVGFLLLAYLALEDSLWPFIAMIEGLLPLYASLGSRTMSNIFWDTFVYLVPAGGLALAALLTITSPKPPHVRVMIGLTLFGVVHLVAQRKGWFYHVYPLAVGMACWGAWSLTTLPMLRSAVCLTITLAMIAWRVPTALSQETTDRALAAASAMQLALESRLPRGATVQALDFGQWRLSCHGARRNATSHAPHPMVFAYSCSRYGAARLRECARSRSAGRCASDEFPMATRKWVRRGRSMAAIRQANDLILSSG